MKALLITLVLVVTSVANAGVVHGTIRTGGSPIQGVSVTIDCDENSYAGTTNERGRYSVNVRHQGKCSLSVSYDNDNPTHKVFSYPDPVQYDFDIVKDDEGRWSLRRK